MNYTEKEREEGKLIIEADPKEIADLVVALQSQPEEKDTVSPLVIFKSHFSEYLQKNIRDTNEEKPDLN